ncbi:MAG: cob(I)yrinic acid a,c-diamide adenosyltransferase [Spirochaetota bacterium]
MNTGYVHLYTGNGKGKTTAAIGMAVRAAGWNMPSIIIQFMKGQNYGELESLKRFNNLITIEQYGSSEFCMPDDENIQQHYLFARKGLQRATEACQSSDFSLVVLDEIVTAMLFKLVTLNEIVSLIKNRNSSIELVLTGRGAPDALIRRCHLVTEMKEVRHYYENGVAARKGFEY